MSYQSLLSKFFVLIVLLLPLSASALVMRAPYDHGLPFQRGIEQLFHGDEEGVHVHVKDRAHC